MKNIEVTHENGYTGIMYGKRSLVILDKDRKEVMHTGFRNKNLKTSKDLYNLLDKFPKLYEMLTSKIDEKEV